MCDEKLGTSISRIAIIDIRQVDEIFIMRTVLLFNVAHVIIFSSCHISWLFFVPMHSYGQYESDLI